MNAPKLSKGQVCVDFITRIPVTILNPLPDRHPKTGERLYMTRSRSGRLRRIQERNLKPIH